MTSRRGSFAIMVELDQKAVQRINARLLELGTADASKAMRRGFSKWGKVAAGMVESYAPFGRANATEKIRGVARPNVHLKFSTATKVKGYKKGLVVWAGVGIREIKGSYLTPHWYLRWVEYGHKIARRATAGERLYALARGDSPRAARSKTLGIVPPNPFMRRAAAGALRLVEPFLQKEIDRAVTRANRG